MLASSPLGRRAECLDHSNPILRGAEVSATVSVLRRDAAKTAWAYSNTPAEPSASAGLVDLSGCSTRSGAHISNVRYPPVIGRQEAENSTPVRSTYVPVGPARVGFRGKRRVPTGKGLGGGRPPTCSSR